MDKTVRKYANFDEMKADEYRYWQSRPAHERMDAVEEMIQIQAKWQRFRPSARPGGSVRWAENRSSSLFLLLMG